jgi:hypothetical protein
MYDKCGICNIKVLVDGDNLQICILRTCGYKRSSGLCFLCPSCDDKFLNDVFIHYDNLTN